jgi:hypothetical protein
MTAAYADDNCAEPQDHSAAEDEYPFLPPVLHRLENKSPDVFEEKYPAVNSLFVFLSPGLSSCCTRGMIVPFLCKSTSNASPRFSYLVETKVAKLRRRMNRFHPGRIICLQDVKSVGRADGLSQTSVGGKFCQPESLCHPDQCPTSLVLKLLQSPPNPNADVLGHKIPSWLVDSAQQIGYEQH